MKMNTLFWILVALLNCAFIWTWMAFDYWQHRERYYLGTKWIQATNGFSVRPFVQKGPMSQVGFHSSATNSAVLWCVEITKEQWQAYTNAWKETQ